MTPPPPLCEKVPTLPLEVEQAVLTALAKDPHQRFATVQAFATALEQASQSGQSQPLVLPKPVTPPSQSEKSQASASLPGATSSKQSPLPTILATLPHPSPQPMMEVPAQNHISHAPKVSDTLWPISQPMSHPSRRAVIAGLAGLTLVGGGVTWFTILHSSTPKLARHMAPTPTPPPIGTLLYTYKGHSDSVRAVAWSPDSKRIVSGSWDGTAQVWDAVDGGHVYTYRGHHPNQVNAIAWSPDGKRIASGSYKAVQVWDAVDGGHVFTYKGHSDFVNAVAWSPNGKYIASGSADKTVQVWEAS